MIGFEAEPPRFPDIGDAKASSSIGRAPVSKTGGWGFDPLLAWRPCAVAIRSRRECRSS